MKKLAFLLLLLILAAALFSHGLHVTPSSQSRAAFAAAIAAVIAMAYVDHSQLFAPTAFLAGD